MRTYLYLMWRTIWSGYLMVVHGLRRMIVDPIIFTYYIVEYQIREAISWATRS